MKHLATSKDLQKLRGELSIINGYSGFSWLLSFLFLSEIFSVDEKSMRSQPVGLMRKTNLLAISLAGGEHIVKESLGFRFLFV